MEQQKPEKALWGIIFGMADITRMPDPKPKPERIPDYRDKPANRSDLEWSIAEAVQGALEEGEETDEFEVHARQAVEDLIDSYMDEEGNAPLWILEAYEDLAAAAIADSMMIAEESGLLRPSPEYDRDDEPDYEG